MCFSSEASFTASGLLLIISAFALYKTKNKSQLMLALIPLLFSIQQASEGIVWLSLQNEHYAALQTLAAYFYLVFAQVVWPIWIPTSVWILEKKKRQKKVIGAFALFGSLVSLYLASTLITHQITPLISCNNIAYAWNTTSYTKAGFLIYAIPVIIPFFISSIAYLWIFGLSIALSLLLSYLFWAHALGSVWCFFAAILSTMVIFFIDHMKKR